MTSELKKTVLSIDIGYGNTKAVWNHKKTTSKPDTWTEICFRSVTPSVVVDTGTALSNLDRVIVHVGADSFYVGPKATFDGGMRALHPDYINTAEHEALLSGVWHYMWKEIGQVSKSVDLLVLGLPVSGFQSNRRRLQELGSKVHRVPVPQELRQRYGKDYEDVVAKKVMVLPQPMGSLRLASEHERDYDLFDDGIVSMVIDVGYNTLDWFVADAMAPQFESCGSFAGGFSQVLKAVSRQIGFDHGVGAQNFGLVERGLVSGEMNFGFKKIPMQQYQLLTRKVADAAISDLLQQFDPQRSGVSRIYLTGGGAAAYKDSLQARLPDHSIELMVDGVMANARGYFLSGMDSLSD